MRAETKVGVLILASLAQFARAQQTQPPVDGELELLPVQGNVYLLAGAGGNIVIQTAEQGTLIVDAGSAGMSAPTGKLSPVDPGGWPTQTFLEERKQMSFNGEPVEIIHLSGAHTDGD